MGCPPVNRVTALAVNPVTPTVLYAGLESNDETDEPPLVWRSDDAGSTWSQAQSGVNLDAQVRSLLIDPNEPRTVYATLADVGHADLPAPLFRSTDGGTTWQPASEGLPDIAYELAHDGTVLYAGTPSGIYTSIDRAQSWAPATVVLTDTEVTSRDVEALAAGDGVVYVSVSGYDAGGAPVARRFVYSTDGGESWQTGAGYPTGADSNRVVVTSDTVYSFWGAQVYRSDDGGATWTSAFPTPNCARLLAPGGRAGDGLVFSQYNGALLHTEDTGQVWTPGSGIRAGGLSSFAALSDTVYAGGVGGVFKSSDRGQTWRFLPLELGNADHAYGAGCALANTIGSVVVHPAASDVIYAGATGYCGVTGGSGNGLFRSEDGGDTWEHAIESGCVQEIVTVAGWPNDVWVVVETGTVYHSDDAGRTWETENTPGWSYDLAVSPRNPDVMLVAVTGTPCVYRTVNGGVTWNGVLDSESTCGFATTVDDLAFNRDDPDVAYADDFVSHDGGLTWKSPRGAPRKLTFDSANTQRAYGLNDGRLHRTLDGGRIWTGVGPWPAGVGANEGVSGHAVGWAETPRLYAYDCDVVQTCRFWWALDSRPYGVWLPAVVR